LITELKSDCTEFVDEDDNVINLATEYITEEIVGQTRFACCLHFALATINQADLPTGWYFKHVVNVKRIRGYNSVNIKNGFKQLDIRSPRELMDYGN